MSHAVPEWAFAAVLFLLVVFRFALAERKTKYNKKEKYLAAAGRAASQAATAYVA